MLRLSRNAATVGSSVRRATRTRWAAAAFAALVTASPAHASVPAASTANESPQGSYGSLKASALSPTVQVVVTSPKGKVTNENVVLRWLFDRPVAPLADEAPFDASQFVTITPTVAGTFRWASTRTLLFEPKAELPLATAFTATVRGIKALDGTVMAEPSVSTFETQRPTCSFYDFPQYSEGFAGAVRVTCTQSVPPPVVAANLNVEFRPVKVSVPRYTPTSEEIGAITAKDPAGAKLLQDRLGAMATRNVVKPSVSLVREEPCSSQGTQRCVVLGLDQVPPRDSRAWLSIGNGMVGTFGPLPAIARAVRGEATPRTPFLVTRGCRLGCQPDAGMGLLMIGQGSSRSIEAFDGMVTAKNLKTNITYTYKSPDGAGDDDGTQALSLSWMNFQPNTSYEITVSKDFATADGTLGYDATRLISLGRRSYFTRVPGQELVLEPSVSSVGVNVRNVTKLDVISRAVDEDQLVDLVRSYTNGVGAKPFTVVGDKFETVVVNKPLDAGRSQSVPFGDKGDRGVFLIAARPNEIVAGSVYRANGSPSTFRTPRGKLAMGGDAGWQATLVQRTDLGVTLKAGRANVLVSVSSLTTGRPVKGASVQLFAGSNESYWSGKTNDEGFALAKPHPQRDCGTCDLVAVVKAKVDGRNDLAYGQTRWREWGLETSYEPGEDDSSAQSQAARKERAALDEKLPAGADFLGTMFTDRGVYRLGEQVHLKGVLRAQTLDQIDSLPSSVTEIPLTVEDPRGVKIVTKKVKVSGNGAFDTTFAVPAGGSQGSYSISSPGSYASFLVTSFRRPDFVVDVKADKRIALRGDQLSAKATSRYLFGAPLANGATRWAVDVYDSYVYPTFSLKNVDPSSFTWTYACFRTPCDETSTPSELQNAVRPEQLDSNGESTASGVLPVARTRHRPASVSFEAEVSDISRQAFADRDVVTVYPGEFMFGVRRTGPFPVSGKAFVAEIIAGTPDDKVSGGVAGTATLYRWEWVSLARVDSNGNSYQEGGWRSTKLESVPFVTRADAVVPVTFTPAKPGTYEVRVQGVDARGNAIESGLVDYVVGPGEVSWEQNSDNPRVELVSDKASYRAGEEAQILVKSPWSKASGLLTIERNGVISARSFEVTGSATVVEVPVTEEFTPNVYVSVALTKGRTEPPSAKTGDRGRPDVLYGVVNLLAPPEDKTLKVSVKADRNEYLPGAQGTASIKVMDAAGKPASGEVTVWAVDEGVLRLTGYSTPDPISTFYAERSLDVSTSDSRMRLSRGFDQLSDADKGDGENAQSAAPGGGGGEETTGNGVRTDFRILAAWSASIAVGDDGQATVPLKLPQSLTAYRLIAVASSGKDKFGSSDSELRISTPFQVRPALPRFVSLGDTFEAGAVLQNLSGIAGPASLQIKLPAGSPLVVEDPTEIVVPSLGSSPKEVRFKLRATALGTASFTLQGKLGDGATPGTTDAAGASIPVLLTQRLDTIAANGEVDATASGTTGPQETIDVPRDAIAGVGGLKLSVSSSNLAGLQQSVESLVEYPYGCLEQRSTRIKVLLGLVTLNDRYTLPGLSADKLRPRVQAEINKLVDYIADDGGLSYWPAEGVSDVYLSAKVLDILLDAKAAKFTIPPGLTKQLQVYLTEAVRGLTNGNEEEEAADIRPVRASVAATLARAGHPEPGLVTTLINNIDDNYDYPYTEKLALLDAMLAGNQTGKIPQDLYADVLASVRIDGDEASVQDPEDWYGTWFSYRGTGTTTATADLLGLLVKIDPKHALVSPLSRWLLNHRVNGTWGDTYTNGSVLHAFTEVARYAESVRPEITSAISAGTIAMTQELGPTSLEVLERSYPLSSLPSGAAPLTVKATGQGTLHWAAQLRYARPAQLLKSVDRGFSVERSYYPYDGLNSIKGRPSTSFKAGDLVTVELLISTPDRRSNIVVDDALPAGFEALDVRLESTANGSTEGTSDTSVGAYFDGVPGAAQAGIDHTEVRDDRVLLFGTQLEPGTFRYTYTARATAPGRFVAAPAHAEEMYRAQTYGRSNPAVVTITPPVS